ncbi:MAG: hypothetical protein HN380_27390 [Victivallales bacterium]|nr:hypothetical protein [Victivallales bacterium]
MLKLTASFGKKLPVEGMDFSSQSYHASVEVEIPEGLAPEELDRRIHDTFDLVRGSVEAELTSGPRPAGFQGAPTGGQDFRPAPQRKAQPASAKQLAYLRDIAVRKGMTVEELDQLAATQFGADSTARLTRDQASRLIDSLGGASAPRQRGQAA